MEPTKEALRSRKFCCPGGHGFESKWGMSRVTWREKSDFQKINGCLRNRRRRFVNLTYDVISSSSDSHLPLFQIQCGRKVACIQSRYPFLLYFLFYVMQRQAKVSYFVSYNLVTHLSRYRIP